MGMWRYCKWLAGVNLLAAITMPLLLQWNWGQQQSYTLADVRQRAEAVTVESDADADFAIQGARLGLPPANSSKDVVEANIDNMEREKLTQVLSELGVPPADGCSEPDLREMLKLAVRSDYWRQYWNEHRNKGMLRMWMFTHDSFRKRLLAIRQELAGDDELSAAQIASLSKQFTEFVTKNERHSDFEDNQLFPYFSETFTQFAEFWQQLHQEHKRYTELVTGINEQLQPAVNSGNKLSGDNRNSLAAAMLRFCEFYEAHMRIEERLLVPLWLNLSEQQKPLLRSRMSGMYWLSSYSF